jgi:hypothetical protein
MKITPEDIMWGWDPMKEDLLLGFRKLPNKDQLLLKAIRYALYTRGHIPSLESSITPGLKKFKQTLREPSTDPWTQKSNNFFNLAKQKDLARDAIDEVIVDATLQMERDGYTQLGNDIPNDLTAAIVEWTLAGLVRFGIVPDSEELANKIRGVYL